MSDDATLFCWIGNTDVLAMAQTGNPPASCTCAMRVLKEDGKRFSPSDLEQVDKSSIVLTLKDSLSTTRQIPKFSNIVLLTNRPNKDLFEEFANRYKIFLSTKFPDYRNKICIKYLHCDAYTFEDVYKAVKDVLDTYIDGGNNADHFWYNITPGTIAQQIAWVLIAKEKSAKSHFVQGSKNKRVVRECRIPFDITSVIKSRASYIESETNAQNGIIGNAPSIKQARSFALKFAKIPVNVLLTGESGTGKEVFAHAIHNASDRRDKPFIAVNCSTLSKELGMSKLTGHLKGAFTGADSETTGELHKANGGTLFLDEIGDCPLEFQAELLRILQPQDPKRPTIRHFNKLGSGLSNCKSTTRGPSGQEEVDVRIICATNRDLTDTQRFREDLYYRIGTLQVQIPSLETRKAETNLNEGIDDIKDLADNFLTNFNEAFIQAPRSSYKKFSPDAYVELRNHIWKGNVRELQNVISRAAIISEGKIITRNDIIACFNQGVTKSDQSTLTALKEIVTTLAQNDVRSGNSSYKNRVAEFLNLYFTAALAATGGNKIKAYKALKANSRTLNNHLSLEGAV